MGEAERKRRKGKQFFCSGSKAVTVSVTLKPKGDLVTRQSNMPDPLAYGHQPREGTAKLSENART